MYCKCENEERKIIKRLIKIFSMNYIFYHLTVAVMVLSGLVSNGQLISVKTSNETVYTATRNGKNIGWLKTTQLQSGNETWLTTESQLVIDILISFTAKAKTYNKYTGIVLTEASVHRTLNGRKKLDNEIRFIDGRYHVAGNDDAAPINKAIRYSVTYLYFNEPIKITEVFSEVYLLYLALKKLGHSTYTTLLPDGGSMTYTYNMGKLNNVVAKTSYGEVTFKLVQ
jgi:hypothetical protein